MDCQEGFCVARSSKRCAKERNPAGKEHSTGRCKKKISRWPVRHVFFTDPAMDTSLEDRISSDSNGNGAELAMADSWAGLRSGEKWPGEANAGNRVRSLSGRLASAKLSNTVPRGFQQAKSTTLNEYPRIPSVLVSAVGWYYDERFQFLAAEAGEQGSRLVAVQHGGGYGMARHSAPEQHESRAADSFLVWVGQMTQMVLTETCRT